MAMTRPLLEGLSTRLPVVLAVLAGLGLSALASFVTFQWEREQQLEAFSRDAEQRLAGLQKSLDDALDQVKVVADFIRAHESLDRETFHRFTASLPERHSFIQAIFWIPRLTHAQRGALENTAENAAADPATPPFRMRAREAGGSLGPAPAKAVYFPVLFVQPRKGNAAMFGLELGSIPSRLEAIGKARDSGKIVISERLILSPGGMAGFGFLALAPIYSPGAVPATTGERRKRLKGFAGITFRIFPLVHHAIPSLEKAKRNFEIAVFDRSAPPGKELLYGENAPVLDFDRLASYPHSSAGMIPMGGRKWMVVFFPSPSFLQEGMSLKFLAVFLAGLFLTGSAGVFLSRLESRRYRIQDEVLRITGELADAMAEIRKKEERFRDIAEAASDWYWETDNRFRFSFFSNKFQEFTGVPPQSWLGQSLFDFSKTGADLRDWENHTAVLEAMRAFRDFVFTYTSEGGVGRIAKISGKPIVDDKGVFSGYRGVGTDITSQEAAQRALAESQERHRSVVEAAALVLMAVDADGIVTVCEGKAMKEMGLAEKGVVGSPIGQFRQNIPSLVEGFTSAMAGETLTREIEIDGKFFETRFSPAAGRDARTDDPANPDGQDGQGGNGAIAVALDVTQARMFHKLRTDFVSAMFHDVRTPLSSIVGYSDILLEDDVGELNDEQREFIEIISTNAARLNELIDDLALVERLEAGHGPDDIQHIDLTAMLSSVAANHGRLINQKSLTLHMDVPVGLTMRGNPARISQVFHQLLSTSVKLTAEGWVRLTARVEADRIVVEVADNGAGIDTSVLDSLFYDYFRADERVIRATGGTGLGLAIAREIVMAHQGTFDVGSEPGKGSTFTVTFPTDFDPSGQERWDKKS